MSLLSQMYPSPGEIIDRRKGQRKYLPSYNVCRWLNGPPDVSKGLDPKPDPFLVRPLGDHRYQTPLGYLDYDRIDQMARHCQWKSNYELNYVIHNPPYDPQPAPDIPQYYSHEGRKDDPLGKIQPGNKEAGGPFEWQRLIKECRLGHRPQLPENKAWGKVGDEYFPFPGNAYPGTKFYRLVEHHSDGRTTAERDGAQNHIKELAKTNNFNPQYVKPMKYFQGVQSIPRLYEDPQRTPGRNPPCWTTNYEAQFNRWLPPAEYIPPEHPQTGAISKSAVLVQPFCPYNNSTQPNTLDYLPMPWNMSDTPHDPRLISGYRL